MAIAIHMIPWAGHDVPLCVDFEGGYNEPRFAGFFAAERERGVALGALACDRDGALVTQNWKSPKGIAPCCFAGWPGWEVRGFTGSSDAAFNFNGSFSNRSSVSQIDYWGQESDGVSRMRELAAVALNMHDTVPRVYRKLNPAQSIVDGFGSWMRDNGLWLAQDNYEQFKAYSDRHYRGRRWEDGGMMVSFPMIGIKRVRLVFGWHFKVSGSALPSAITCPLRVCFSPVVGEKRLFFWPEDGTLRFEGDDAYDYACGFRSPQTFDLSTALPLSGESGFKSAAFDIDVPASGLGHMWCEIDPWKYQAYATEMMRPSVEGLFDTKVYTTCYLWYAKAIG